MELFSAWGMTEDKDGVLYLASKFYTAPAPVGGRVVDADGDSAISTPSDSSNDSAPSEEPAKKKRKKEPTHGEFSVEEGESTVAVQASH